MQTGTWFSGADVQSGQQFTSTAIVGSNRTDPGIFARSVVSTNGLRSASVRFIDYSNLRLVYIASNHKGPGLPATTAGAWEVP